MGDDEEPTFDVTLDDLTAEEFAILASGLGQQMLMYAERGHSRPVNVAGKLTHKLLVENKEMARCVILDAEVANYVSVTELDEETKEELEIEIVDGEPVDAREFTNIEVDGT